jgi:hypothetical protein
METMTRSSWGFAQERRVEHESYIDQHEKVEEAMSSQP